jgi:IMP dehydrogenase
MAKIIWEPSRTFAEFLLLPNLTKREHKPASVDLTSPLVKFKKGEKPALVLGVPFCSASMQSVSGVEMGVALGEFGGIAFVFCSQTIEAQAEMIRQIKSKGNSFLVGAAVNTHDYRDRIPPLVDAGVDALCIDSSDGFSEWQFDVIAFVREKYGDRVKIGAGNVVDAEGFDYLAQAGADFIKVGVGGGSICITREQKGIGRGQASALIEVVEARAKHLKKTGVYIPVCSDGGIEFDNHAIVALAMGADFLMMGRNFARYAESPSKIVTVNGKKMKEYWGEGSSRAQNWQRYGKEGDGKKLVFEEGVDSVIDYAGPLADGFSKTIAKIKATMCNCGSLTLAQFAQNARLTVVSQASIAEGGAHNVVVRTSE